MIYADGFCIIFKYSLVSHFSTRKYACFVWTGNNDSVINVGFEACKMTCEESKSSPHTCL